MQENTFESLELDPNILSALEDAGYKNPTEIQTAAIPLALEGHDLMATAQTGTGKTAAFSLPMLQQLIAAASAEDEKEKKVKLKGLILSPTRELAQQIEENLLTYSKNLPIKVLSVVGGLPINKQINGIKAGVDIVVATPGRLLDLIQRRAIDLRSVKFFVLDEADRMLDMGFVHDVRDIARKLQKERQTLLFSATTSTEVKQLSRVLLKDPQLVAVDPPDTAGENIIQKVYYVDKGDKRELVMELLKDEAVDRALIFTMTKSNANLLAAVLNKKGIEADAIHSDKGQKDRQKALKAFDDGSIRVLVATDVMARGIDVDGISHVINFELPNDPEGFVHRIGRTARAGSSGYALSFCDLDEVKQLRSIESFLKAEIEVEENHKFHSPFIQTMKGKRDSPFGRKKRFRRR